MHVCIDFGLARTAAGLAKCHTLLLLLLLLLLVLAVII